MKKFLKIIGIIAVAAAIVFALADYSIVTSDGSVVKDILGFTVPKPPIWTSFVPFLGGIISFIYQYFSLHGLVSIAITGLVFGIGVNLIGLSDKRPKKHEAKKLP